MAHRQQVRPRPLGGSLKGQTRQYGILFPAHFLIQMHERWSCKIALVDIFLWLVCLGHRNGARGRSRPLERRGAGDRYTAQRHQRITLTLNQSRLDCFTSGLIAVARLTQGIRPSTALRPFAGQRSFGGMSDLHPIRRRHWSNPCLQSQSASDNSLR